MQKIRLQLLLLVIFCLLVITVYRWRNSNKSYLRANPHLRKWHMDNDARLILKKVLSYCVFGKDALQKYKFSIESILHESSDSKLYSGWEVRLYTDVDIDAELFNTWQKINPKFNIKNVKMLTEYSSLNLESINAMTWRFLPIGDTRVDISCIRDLDSPLLKREEAAVQEFLDSDYIFHGMRDNPHHGSQIMGGMWCFRNIKYRLLGKQLLSEVLKHAERREPGGSKEATKGNDQNVLNYYVWPVIIEDSMTHDSYLCDRYKYGPQKYNRPFPTKRFAEEFVGCIRPCVSEKKFYVCPVNCRPKHHQDWTYC